MSFRIRLQTFLSAILFLILPCACSSEEWPVLPEEKDDAIELSAAIERPSGITTRAIVGEKGNETFLTGDRISLFVTPCGKTSSKTQHHILTLASDGWLPKLSWKDIGGERAAFSAIFPEIADKDADWTIHTVATDQRAPELYGKSDLLFASTDVKQGESVALSFRHQLSLIELRLTSSSTFSPEQLARATVRIHAYPSVRIRKSPKPEILQTETAQIEDIIFHQGKNAVFHAILPPQPILETWRKNWIEIELEGNTYVYGAPDTLSGGETLTELLSGRQLTLSINLDRGQITEDWANKTVWIYGVKDIPPVDKWDYATDDGMGHGFAGLKWNPQYGWFDCNKKNPTEGTGLDSNMCWAAASANMIYWWLEQNKDFVARYNYSGPSEYGNSVDSDVFELYRTHFNDTGNDVSGALSWFFSGRPLAGGKQSPAYFKDLVGENEFVATVVPIYTSRSLSDELKAIFKSEKAIECTISTARLIHAVNIWGAEFDETGEVCALYVTDNNDTDLYRQTEGFDFLGRKKTQAGLLYKPVKRIDNKYYMEGSVKGKYSFYINELNTLDLMRDKWEAFFH